MKKDAYYFPHFCNARHDRKVLRLRMELGVEGYGIFFMLLEVLRDQTDFCYPIEDIPLLAKEFDTSEQKVRTVICNYQLFEIDKEQMFFSPKMLVYLEPFFKMKTQRINASNKRWGNEITDGCDRNAVAMQSKVKKSKVKKSKVNIENKFIPPTIEEVKEFFKEKGYTEESAIKAFNHYAYADWKDSAGKKVISWKQKMNTVWFKPEYKIKETPKEYKKKPEGKYWEIKKEQLEKFNNYFITEFGYKPNEGMDYYILEDNYI